MPTIDDKVVAMSFENSKFESGVKQTLSSLDKLKNSLQFPNAGKGLDNLNASAKQVNLSHISQGVDAIRKKLGFLSVAALAVFANIAQRAVAAGAQLAKSLTIEPLIAGFQEYTTNLNSIQTILGNTKASGADLQDVNAALLELNKYSDKTIYNFSEMARNIGTFTAAGVALKPATAAIKGIANLAALSGSNSQQASTAMYQLSQAISAGRVSLMDWNSVVNAGMGGTVFQRALAQTAVTMGELPKSALKLVGPMKNVSIHGQSFRQSMMAAPGKQSWLTSDVLTKTLAQFTGDMTDAELAAEGFSKAQIKAIQQQAQMAMHAATQVKTLTQVIDVAKETAGSGWAQTWQIIFGDFGEAKRTFTALSTAINGFINVNAAARNKVLGDWKELGGRTVLIEGLKTAWRDLAAVLKPIRDAFRDIFPRKTGKELYDLTVGFKNFAEAIKPSEQTVENIRRTFRGLFAVLDIGKQIVSGIFHVLGQLFSVVGTGDGAFLGLTANIGDFLVALDKALKSGEGLENFFDGLGTLLAIPVKLFGQIAEAISNLFTRFSPGGFSVQIDGVNAVTEGFKRTVEAVAAGLEGLGPAISNAVSHMNFEAILSVINTGLFAALVLAIRKFIGGSTIQKVMGGFGNAIAKGLGRNIGGLGKLGGVFGSLTGSLQAMQSNLKAQTLERIAIAIALLSASVVALSFVNPKRLNASLGAMAIMFGELIGALMIMDKVLKTTGAAKLALISAELIMLATAIDLLTIAVFAMSKLSWSELVKGLGGVAALLVIIARTSGPLSANSAGMIRAGAGIAAIAVGLNIMALAIKQLGSMDLGDLAKGLGAVAFGLWAIAETAQETPKGMIAQGAGMIALAAGLYILAEAVEKFASMNLPDLAKGLGAVAISLFIVSKAMKAMPSKTMMSTAAGLVLVGAALNLIAMAVQTMGGMSMAEIAKGLIGLGGALWILSKALGKMSLSVKSAAALIITATALRILASAMVTMGSQSWGSIVKGLVGLGAAMGIMGIAAKALSSSIPALLGFGAALVLIGGGMALAGAGIALIGVGLSSIAVAGPVAIGILIQALIDLTEAIPRMAKNLVLGLLEIVKAFANTAPQFVNAMVKIIDSIALAIAKSAPRLAESLAILVESILQALAKHAPKIIQAGFDILIALLKGINDNLSQVVTQAAKIVVTFLGALAKNANKIISAGFDLVISIVRGITNNIGKVISAGANIIVKFISGIAKNIGKIISEGAKAVVNFVTGIGNAGAQIVKAGTNAIIKFVQALGENSIRLINAGAQALLKFLNGLADAIDKYEYQLLKAGFRIAKAIIEGLIKGIVELGKQAIQKAMDLGKKVINALGDAVKFWSPSHESYAIGLGIVEGLVIGLSQSKPAINAATAMGLGVINAFNKVFETASPSKVMKRIGRFVTQGFADGLTTGAADDVKQAFANLKNMLAEGIADTKDMIAAHKAKLKELREHPEANAKAIKAEEAALKKDQTALERLLGAQKKLTAEMKAHKGELLKLAKEYAETTEKLEAAQDVLDEAITTRAEAAKGYTEQYSELPDFIQEGPEGVDPVTAYLNALKNQAEAITKYKETLEKLRTLGLDDTTYKKLLAEGTKGQDFASQLLAAGPDAIKQLNALDEQVMKASAGLADEASGQLYDAGVAAAQGVVDGLKAQQANIIAEMDVIANALVNSIKKKLGIRSPSKAFAEIGQQSISGLAKGLSDAKNQVAGNVEEVASSALTALQNKMGEASSIMSEELNADAVITPILDLSRARSEADKMAALLGATPIDASVSLGQASAIAVDRNRMQEDLDKRVAAAQTSFKFEQNNYSPEALSEIEIYRQTRNQLAQLKSMVFVPV